MPPKTDLSNVASAVSGIQIDGPGGPATTGGRVELNDENVLTILPGELDERVGKAPQPPVAEAEESDQDDEEEELDEDGPEEEEDDDDLEPGWEDAAEPGREDALFDPRVYDMSLLVDGQSTDVIQVALSGGVKLVASEEEAKAFFRALRLGRFVDLRVSGYVSAKQGSYSENAEGETTVTGKATVKATEVRLLTPEEL